MYYYRAGQVQDPQKGRALCNNCEKLKAINYYWEVLHLSYGRVHGSVWQLIIAIVLNVCHFSCLISELSVQQREGLERKSRSNSVDLNNFDHYLTLWCLVVTKDHAYLKLVSIFVIFLFFHQMTALQKLWKVFFISSKKLFLFLRYSIFCNYFPYFLHFPDTKGQIEVE